MKAAPPPILTEALADLTHELGVLRDAAEGAGPESGDVTLKGCKFH